MEYVCIPVEDWVRIEQRRLNTQEEKLFYLVSRFDEYGDEEKGFVPCVRAEYFRNGPSGVFPLTEEDEKLYSEIEQFLTENQNSTYIPVYFHNIDNVSYGELQAFLKFYDHTKGLVSNLILFSPLTTFVYDLSDEGVIELEQYGNIEYKDNRPYFVFGP